jgi:prephenate dehydrogenase
MNFSKITIIGLGLIGGSLAWALKKSGRVGEVFGVDVNEKTIDYAVLEGVIDRGSKQLEDGVKRSEIVVIATHVGIIPKIANSVASLVSSGAIITDVGSVKRKIVEEVESSLPSHLYFVGGHPIAGTEHSGVWAADFRLFEGKRCILTLTAKTYPEALDKVKGLWETVGAKVFMMNPETHDRIFSFMSHLPHAVAYALVNAVASVKDLDNIFDFAGGGLRDYTRIGRSSPDMWSDIFLMNKENVLEAIWEFKKALKRIEKSIEQEDLAGLKEELRRAAKIKEDMDK